MFLRNVGCNSRDYTASHPRRWYSSLPRIFVVINLTKSGHLSCRKEIRNTKSILVRKIHGNSQLRRPRHKWEAGTGVRGPNYQISLPEN
jgi:hypothetical protein